MLAIEVIYIDNPTLSFTMLNIVYTLALIILLRMCMYMFDQFRKNADLVCQQCYKSRKPV